MMHTVIHNWYLKGWREKKGKGETQGLVASQGYCCEGYTQTPGRKVLQQKGIHSCKCGSLFLLMSHWETGLSGAKKNIRYKNLLHQFSHWVTISFIAVGFFLIFLILQTCFPDFIKAHYFQMPWYSLVLYCALNFHNRGSWNLSLSSFRDKDGNAF